MSSPDSLDTNVSLAEAFATAEARIIPFVTVRVHRSVLLLHPCATLWYFCKALDKNSCGKIVLTPQQLQQLGKPKSTIYRWLREGKKLGMFRRPKWEGNSLNIILGGLKQVCRRSQIKKWGAAADEITLAELLQPNGRRKIASAITTQDLQDRSRYAAKKQLNQLERKCFELPTVDQLLNSQTSQQMNSGRPRGVVHLGDSRLFVGRSFIPFGVSQKRVCEELNSEPTSCGVSRWTLRRHLDSLGIAKRQVMQARPEYREINNVIQLGATSWTCKSDADISFRYVDTGVILLDEPNGNSSARRDRGHKLELDRFCRYRGATWLHRCNLYNLSYTLTSMKMTRHLWKREQLRAVEVPVENSPPGALAPLDPPLNESPAACSKGSAAGGQNKGSKNDNPQNAQPEDNSANSGGLPPCMYEVKAKLLQQQLERKQAKQKSVETSSLDPIKDYWAKVYGR